MKIKITSKDESGKPTGYLIKQSKRERRRDVEKWAAESAETGPVLNPSQEAVLRNLKARRVDSFAAGSSDS